MLLSLRSALAVLIALTAPCSGGAPDGRSEFEEALAQAQKQAAAGRWKEAKGLLDATLETHVDQGYVRERRDELRSLLADCAFELAVPNRGVKGLFCGDVASYDARKGEIELRWERPKPAKAGEPEPAFPCEDFERTSLGLLFRGPFDGPHSLEISGKAIGQDVPHLLGCWAGDRYYDCALDAGSGHVIQRVDAGDRKLLAMTTDIYNVGRPYLLKLSVDARRIEATYNGKRLVQADKVEGEYGRVGFHDVLEPRKIVVRGKLDKTWTDGEIAALRKRERASFDATHDVNAELPEWLRKE